MKTVNHGLDRVRATFDDESLVSDAGLLLVATLAARLGLESLIDATVRLVGRVGGARPGRKVLTSLNTLPAGTCWSRTTSVPCPDMPGDPSHGQDAGSEHPSRRRVLHGLVSATAATVLASVAGSCGSDPQTAIAAMLASTPFVIAHRGGDADRPELSMAAYRHALRSGADGVEVSLARTSDGVWFGLHDATLDRTSGTTGFVAAAHTWAEVSALRITAGRGSRSGDPPEPYARLEEILALVGGRVAVFVDPKTVPRRYHSELLDLLIRSVPDPAGTLVAKSFVADVAWPDAARRRGLRTWGYAYGRDMTSSSALASATADRWNLLGLNLSAPRAVWQHFVQTGRPVIAHVLQSRAQLERAQTLGAHGVMSAHLPLGSSSST